MKLAPILALACIGTAVVLLFTTDKGKKIREDIMDEAEEWGEKLGKLAEDTGVNIKDMQKRLKKELVTLSDDAKEKILSILDEGGKKAKNVKDMAASQLN